ncbi:MAG: type III-A CRISPR-associated protein Csm2 [Magnetococcales bacterium]|nr:type III-A CRISPR-associated protein Csm2 [Magnetococcales bacterium]
MNGSYATNKPSGGRRTGSTSTPPLDSTPSLDLSKVLFKQPIDKDLFDGVAQTVAKTLASNKKSNKSSQLRRFYDEICMWAEKVGDHEENFHVYLPFIRMLNAKVAYANGRRDLVDVNFVNLINHGLKQVEQPVDLKHFKLFMEAVMGFYKQERPKDS